MTPDADLVRRCLAGDRAAWAALLARYADLIHGLLHRAGLDAESRADAFQEVSLLLWKNLRRVKEAERLLPWIATTTRRVAWRDRKRRRARDARQAAAARPEATDETPETSAAALEEEQAVRESLAAMEERCRRLLRALYFEAGAEGYDEVARRLGIPRGSIGPTRRRCLERLRAELGARGVVADDVSGGGSAASRPVEAPAPADGDDA